MELYLLSGLAAAAAAINSGLTVWSFLQSPSKANAESIAKLGTRIEALERTTGTHGAKLDQLPDKDSLHELQLVVERTNSEVRVMGETLKGVKETSNLMRDWLLEKGIK